MALEATTSAQVNPKDSFAFYAGEEEPPRPQRREER